MTSDPRPKRFYKAVTIAPDPAGFAVLLDGRPVKTPDRNTLTAPTETAARLIAAEWEAQGERIEFSAMPATRYANLILDRTPAARAALAEEVARYGETDLLCHLADFPTELRASQEAVWAPIRDWADQAFGVRLIPVEGVIATPQPPASLAALKAAAGAMDDWRLTLVAAAAPVFSSALLALALDAGRLSPDAAYDASIIDETFQAAQWGADEEAQARLDRLRAEIRLIGALQAALKG